MIAKTRVSLGSGVRGKPVVVTGTEVLIRIVLGRCQLGLFGEEGR